MQYKYLAGLPDARRKTGMLYARMFTPKTALLCYVTEGISPSGVRRNGRLIGLCFAAGLRVEPQCMQRWRIIYRTPGPAIYNAFTKYVPANVLGKHRIILCSGENLLIYLLLKLPIS